MSPTGEPEDMLVGEACRDLRPSALRGRIIEPTACRRLLLDLPQVRLADRDLRRQQRPTRLSRLRREGRGVAPEVVPDLTSRIRTGRSHLPIRTGTESRSLQTTGGALGPRQG
ncbi:hypothetical protein [Streptomyces antibioticus]|uniref:hypothetical protein n=1 Tax=Streptomyces antibioticus TaxID=1890 RepID=UPI003790A49D